MATKKVKDPPILNENASPAAKKPKVVTKPATISNAEETVAEDDYGEGLTRAKTSARKSLDAEPHIRDTLNLNPMLDGKLYIKVVTWNVNGLTALINGKKQVLENLIKQHNPDILCLQETKIQETLVEEYSNLLPNYWSFWNCSTVKKGYSGTVILSLSTAHFN